MRVLIFEQWIGGHYTNYLELLVPTACELATEVVVAICAPFYHSEQFQNAFSPLFGLPNLRFDIQVPKADPKRSWKHPLSLIANLRDAIERNAPDYVIVPSGDAQTIALAMAGTFLSRRPLNVAAECILHGGYGPGALSFGDRAKKMAYDTVFSRSSWQRLNLVNFLVYESLAPRVKNGRMGMIPDPVPRPPAVRREEARRLLGVPDDGRLIGFIGLMDHRKAIPELLQAFRLARLGATDRLVLAGEIAPQFSDLIRREYADLQRQGRLIVIDRWLTEAELPGSYSALDLVCLPYNHFPGLSSLMLKAIAARRPLLVHDFGWMRAVAKRFDAASVSNVQDPAAFAIALESALERAPQYEFTLQLEGLVEYHDPTNFVEHSLRALREYMNKPARRPLKSWDSVMDSLEPARRNLY